MGAIACVSNNIDREGGTSLQVRHIHEWLLACTCMCLCAVEFVDVLAKMHMHAYFFLCRRVEGSIRTPVVCACVL